MKVHTGYKESELGLVPADWAIRSVGSMGQVLTGKALAVNAPGKPRPYLRTVNVLDGQIDVSDVLSMPMTDQQFKHFMLRRGDVLLNEGQSIELVGRCAKYECEYPHPCAIQNQLLRFRARPDVSPSFATQLFRYCQTSGVLQRIALQTTSVAHLGSTRFASLCLPWANSESERRAIAATLDDADALVKSLTRLIDKSRELKQAAMQQLLTGRTRLPGFASPWDVRLFGDLFRIMGGHTASRDQLSPVGYCYLHYGDIHMRPSAYIDLPAEYDAIPKLDVPLERINIGSLLGDGDVVFVDASEDDAGASKHVVIVNPDGIPFISGLHTIVAKATDSALAHAYRRYCFQTEAVRAQFLFYAVGTKVKGISKRNIAKLEIPVPSLAEQIAIATVLSDIDAELAALEARRRKLLLIKRGMTQELLTGRTRLA